MFPYNIKIIQIHRKLYKFIIQYNYQWIHESPEETACTSRQWTGLLGSGAHWLNKTTSRISTDPETTNPWHHLNLTAFSYPSFSTHPHATTNKNLALTKPKATTYLQCPPTKKWTIAFTSALWEDWKTTKCWHSVADAQEKSEIRADHITLSGSFMTT